jgi:hypothetical protein
VIPELGAHRGGIQQNRRSSGIQQRNLDSGVSPPNLHSALDAAGSIAGPAYTREREPDLYTFFIGRYQGIGRPLLLGG